MTSLLWTTLAAALAADISLLPGAPVSGEGEQDIYLRGPALVPGAVLKVKPEAGRVVETELLGGGLARVRYLPEPVAAPTQVELRITVSGAEKVEERIKLDLQPARRGPLRMESSAPAAQPGGQPLTLTIGREDGAPPQDYLLSASAGTLGPVAVLPDGAARVQWTPPPKGDLSELVLITAADPYAPSQAVGYGLIPLLAPRRQSLEAPPDSTVHIEVGGQRLGPYTASPTGGLSVPLEVDPRSRQATIETTTRQGLTRRSPMQLPASDRALVALVGLPGRVPLDPTRPLPLLLVGLDSEGKPLSEAPGLTATSGQLSAAQALSPGWWRVEWTAPATGGATVSFQVGGKEGRLFTSNTGPGLPSVILQATPAALAPRQKEISVQMVAKSPSGATLSSPPALTAVGATRVGSPSRSGAMIQQKLKPTGDRAWLMATALPAATTGLPAVDVQVCAPRRHPGDQRLPVQLVPMDALGMPVPNVELSVALPEGGAAPPTVRSDASGLARLEVNLPADGDAIPIVVKARGWSSGGELPPAGAPMAGPRGSSSRQTAGVRVCAAAPWLAIPPAAPAPVVASAARPAPTSATSTAPAPAPVAPATPTTPAAPSPAPRPARSPQTGGGLGLEAWALGGPLLGIYESEADRGQASPLALAWPGEGMGNTGAGAQLGAVLWLADDHLGLQVGGDYRKRAGEAEADGLPIEVDVGEWSALAGLRYTIAPEARLRTTLLAQVQRQSIPVFLHSVDGDFEMYPAPALGGRAGLAFGLGEGRVRSGLELAELLVPWPVDTSAGLHVEAELIQGLGLRAGAELHLRTLRYDVAAIDEVYVMDQQAQALVGLSYRR